MNVSCQYVVRVGRNASLCQGLRGGIGMDEDSSFGPSKNEKVRSLSCVYFYPSPLYCIPRANPEGLLVLHFLSFSFLIQIAKEEGEN